MEGMHDQNRRLDIVPFIGEWFWDGKVETDTVFGEELDADANGHACLQHGKKNTKARCSGGYKQAVPIMLDMWPFFFPFLSTLQLKYFWQNWRMLDRYQS